jgi:hypothetical protein
MACLIFQAGGSSFGCAASAIGEPSIEPDDGAAQGDDGDEGDDTLPPAPDASLRPDASKPAVADSGTRDAGPRDGGSQAPVDAGQDAGADAGPDAGTDAAADAGVDTGAPLPVDPPKDAGTEPEPEPEPVGECSENSDCKKVCIVGGIFPCCKANNSCGCSLFPGAFCL